MTSTRRSHASWVSTPEALVVSVAVLLAIAGGVAFRLATGSTSRTTAAWTVGGDFVAFYIAGRILNQGAENRLYDLELQERIYRELVPGATGLPLPYVYPPLVAPLFQPLARLPYSTALFLFLVITPIAFLGALALLVERFGPRRWDERAVVLVGGLSFFPFVGYTWLGAQIPVIGLMAATVALVLEDRGRLLLSGLALSLCLYKPNLLVLIVPMLLVSRRFQQLAGFAIGAALLTLLSVAVVGTAASVAFLDMLTSLTTSTSTAENSPYIVAYRNVDLNAFSRLIPYGRSFGGLFVIGTVAVISLTALVKAWRQCNERDRAGRLLVWAATLTWTSVLNIRTPAYDSILVVAAAVLAVAAVRERQWEGWNRLAPMLLCVYVAPWVAEVSTRVIRLQAYTLALVAFGTLLLYETRRTRTTSTLPSLTTRPS